MSIYDPNNPYGGGPIPPPGGSGYPPGGLGGGPPGGFGSTPGGFGPPGQPPFNPYGSPMQPGGPSQPTPVGTVFSLVLGILSLVSMLTCCCSWVGIVGEAFGIGCGIAAIVLGNMGLAAIRAGTAPASSSGLANAGKICGIIGVSVNALLLVVTILMIVGLLALPAFLPQPPQGGPSPFDSGGDSFDFDD